jgi:hypothetical protein
MNVIPATRADADPVTALSFERASAPRLKWSDGWLLEDLVGGLGPDEGMAAVVPPGDELADLGFEVLD